MKEQIKDVIQGYLHTVSCGICYNNQTDICKYCSVKDSTRIMWKISDSYLDSMVEEIIQKKLEENKKIWIKK